MRFQKGIGLPGVRVPGTFAPGLVRLTKAYKKLSEFALPTLGLIHAWDVGDTSATGVADHVGTRELANNGMTLDRTSGIAKYAAVDNYYGPGATGLEANSPMFNTGKITVTHTIYLPGTIGATVQDIVRLAEGGYSRCLIRWDGANDRLQFTHANGTTHYNLFVSAPAKDTWMTVTFVLGGGDQRVYVNGALVTSSANVGYTFSTTVNHTLSWHDAAGYAGYTFEGHGGPSVWHNDLLTADQVAAEHNAIVDFCRHHNFAPKGMPKKVKKLIDYITISKTSLLRVFDPFDTSAGDQYVTDQTANAAHGVFGLDATVETTDPVRNADGTLTLAQGDRVRGAPISASAISVLQVINPVDPADGRSVPIIQNVPGVNGYDFLARLDGSPNGSALQWLFEGVNAGPTAAITFGAWQAVQVSADGAGQSSYKNGAIVGSTANNATVSFDTTGKLSMGLYHSGNGEQFRYEGGLGPAIVFGRKLTDAEHTQLYADVKKWATDNGLAYNTLP